MAEDPVLESVPFSHLLLLLLLLLLVLLLDSDCLLQ